MDSAEWREREAMRSGAGPTEGAGSCVPRTWHVEVIYVPVTFLQELKEENVLLQPLANGQRSIY